MSDRKKFRGRAGTPGQPTRAARLHESLFRGDGPGNLPGPLVHGLRVAYLTYREFLRDFCWDRAASLTFTTIISLLPIAVLTLSFFGLFVEDGKLQSNVKDFVDRRLEAIFQVSPGRSGEEPLDRGGDSAGNDAATPGGGETPLAAGPDAPAAGVPEDLRTFVDAWITRYVSASIFRANVINNLVAIVTLVIASLALLVSMERAFNRIWNVPGKRSYFQKFVTFWMILTTSPLLVAATFVVDRYTRQGTVLGDYMAQFGVLEFVYGFVVPLTISCLAFTFANLLLPKTRVKWLPAMAGGCFSGALWLVLKSNFYFYAQRAIAMQSFYGSLAIVPIFLVFVYLAWLVILAGGELSYTLQNYRRLVRAQVVHGRACRFSPPFLALFVLDRILAAYSGGAPLPPIDSVADELGVEREALATVVRCLEEEGVLVECADEPLRWTFAVDPASVPLDRVIARLLALEYREEDPQDRPVAAQDVFTGMHAEARGAYLAAFRGRKLVELRRSPGNDEAGRGVEEEIPEEIADHDDGEPRPADEAGAPAVGGAPADGAAPVSSVGDRPDALSASREGTSELTS